MKNKVLFILFVAFNISLYAQIPVPLAGVQIQQPALVCHPGECTTLVAEYYASKSTDNYNVSSITYSPNFPFNGGTILNASGDDMWTSLINLPFSFCFYGAHYNQILVGTNGVVTFDTTNQAPGGFSPWNFSGAIPNTSFPIKNAIYGVYQDTDIRTIANGGTVSNALVQNVNYYVLDTGVHVAPNRVFVANFNELPVYSCGSNVGLQTSQIVIYETTNIIDINVKTRTSCTTWNSGSGLIGIQNQAGTAAVSPPGRNTGTWSTSNEAWRFTPNGTDLPVAFSWYNNGTLLANETASSLAVCPTNNESSYSVKMAATNCTSTIFESNTINQLLVPEPAFLPPADLSFCTQSPFVYVADLEANTSYVLGSLNPQNYTVAYYETLVDAENEAPNAIANPSVYSFTENKTIYMSIDEVLLNGCHYVKPFQLVIVPIVNAPTGNTTQNFTSGQTLADLNVIGENIIWYDAAVGGNLLPSTTPLQDNTTYYAAQIVNGCESNRTTNSHRLAVTVNLVLNNATFATDSYVVYPNPMRNFVTVSNEELISSILIYNTLGQEVLALQPNQKEITISTSKFSKGVYFLKATSLSGNKTIKIIKE